MGFTMGKFHRHEDGTVHSHDHAHTHGDHSGYATGTQRIEVLESSHRWQPPLPLQ